MNISSPDYRQPLLRLNLSVALALATTLATLHAGLPDPWRFLTPHPQGNDLLAVWAPAPDQVYAGGHGGVIQHWNGSQWTTQVTPTQKTIFAIHGLSATDIWAVGGDPYTENPTNRCLILHFDGVNWKELPAPRYFDYTYPFNAVHAVAANDVWASHDLGTSLAHYNGSQWNWVDVPLGVEGSFKAITSAGPDHLYVAGTHGQILHRDQGTWRLEQKRESGNFTFNIISRLWAFDADHVFAAGNWTQFYRRNTDGSWAELPVGASEPFGIGFSALWGRSPTEVYLMNENSVFRYDGVNPAVRTEFRTQIRRQWLAGTGVGDRLYGVGPAGVAHEYLLNAQGGGSLSALTVGGQADLDFIPAGVISCGTTELIAFGFAHDGPGRWPLWYIAHGLAQPFPTLPPGATPPMWVRAASGTGPRDVIVAWENWMDWQRGVHRWDGQQWHALPGADGTLTFWRSPTGRLHAAGQARVQVWKDDTTAWETLYTLPMDQPESLLNALWGRTDNELFVGTIDGKVLRYNGTTWNPETTPGNGVITAITGSASDTYAVGQNGLAWRRSGTSWQPLTGITPKTDEHFSAIAAGADGVYAAQRTPSQYTGGGLGRLWRFNSTTATLVLQGLSQPLDALTRTEAGHLVGFAAHDFIITDAPQSAAPTLQRLDLTATSWQTAGDTGVAFRSATPLTSRPVIALQRIAAPAPFAPDPAPYGEHWLILEDKFYSGTAIPPLQVRVQYDPVRLAPGLPGTPLNLYRQTETGLSEVPCLHDPEAHTLTTLDPVDFSIWTVGPATVTLPPTLTVTRSTGQNVTLAWPASAIGYVLEAAVEPSSSAAWTPVPETPQIDGDQTVVTVNTAARQQFFRLRHPR